jgi:hypothetical protein
VPDLDLDAHIDAPFLDCLEHGERNCVSECCGIDSFSTDPRRLAGWCTLVGSETVEQMIDQVDALVALVADRSTTVTSIFLNHGTIDEQARQALLTFLSAFSTAFKQWRADPVASQPRPWHVPRGSGSAWRWLVGHESRRLQDELARELPWGHVLLGRRLWAFAQGRDPDDVAFVVDGGLCVVHLTGRVETDPAWPEVTFVVEPGDLT